MWLWLCILAYLLVWVPLKKILEKKERKNKRKVWVGFGESLAWNSVFFMEKMMDYEVLMFLFIRYYSFYLHPI